jgi:acyl-CoA reductase-like NAD-dependent aldehyde dehydrogenase
MSTATVAPTTYLNFIDGEWRASRTGRTFENINPADTRDVVGLLQESDAADVDAAVQAGQKAFPAWASMPAPARGKILLKAAAILESRIAEMGDLLAREEGKTIGEAKGEVTRAVRILEYFGGEGARLSGQTIPSERPRVFMYTIKQPLGVVALIAPWNFTIAITNPYMAPALV